MTKTPKAPKPPRKPPRIMTRVSPATNQLASDLRAAGETQNWLLCTDAEMRLLLELDTTPETIKRQCRELLNDPLRVDEEQAQEPPPEAVK